MTAFLSASGVWKEFPQPGTSVTALADVTLAIGRGEFVVVTGGVRVGEIDAAVASGGNGPADARGP